MKKVLFLIPILFALLGNYSIKLIAQPGKLDNSFGTGGKVVTPELGMDLMSGASVMVQPDNKIIVAGSLSIWSFYEFAVVRYNKNGTLDSSFSDDGKTTTRFGSANSYARTAVLQTDGKIVVGGVVDSGGTYYAGIARYNTNGSLDSTFSGDGKAIIINGNNTVWLNDISIQADGKIVFVGNRGNELFIIRINTNGSYDMSFNSKGWNGLGIGIGSNNFTSIALQSDGKIVATGNANGNGLIEIAIVRLNTNGTLDNTFGSNGKASIKVAASDNYAKGIAIQPDGKIVIAGYVSKGSEMQCGLIRLNTDGTMDNSFSGDGQLYHSILAGDDFLNDLIIQPDGKILAIGTAEDSFARTYFAIVRYNSNGTFDNSFNTIGMVTLEFGTANNYGASVALQPDNKILVAGSASSGTNYSSIAIARYQSGLASSLSEDYITVTNIYPNPANDYLHIDYKLTVPGLVTIQLRDIQGRIIIAKADNKQMEAGLQTETINLQSLATGMYTLVVRTLFSEQAYLIVH
jgi:uncharacterized delta-60 repeat protein